MVALLRLWYQIKQKKEKKREKKCSVVFTPFLSSLVDTIISYSRSFWVQMIGKRWKKFFFGDATRRWSLHSSSATVYIMLLISYLSAILLLITVDKFGDHGKQKKNMYVFCLPSSLYCFCFDIWIKEIYAVRFCPFKNNWFHTNHLLQVVTNDASLFLGLVTFVFYSLQSINYFLSW